MLPRNLKKKKKNPEAQWEQFLKFQILSLSKQAWREGQHSALYPCSLESTQCIYESSWHSPLEGQGECVQKWNAGQVVQKAACGSKGNHSRVFSVGD